MTQSLCSRQLSTTEVVNLGDLEHKSFVVISDDLSHDKKSVYAFNKAMLKEVRKITPVTKVHYWSDGAASQFKNRYNLANILFMRKPLKPKQHGAFLKLSMEKGLSMVL